MKRDEALSRAADLVSGDRDRSYGDAKESFGRTAAMWSAILGVEVTPQQFGQCMIALKLSRLANSPNHEDSAVDIAGYAALLAELMETPHPQTRN